MPRQRTSAAQAREPASGSFEIARGIVPPELVDDALRVLHVDLLEKGATRDELGTWLWGADWFPHLKHSPEITRLATALPEVWRAGQVCDPQILLQFPHTGPEPPITFHVDQEPDWAAGRRYSRIVGFPLSPWRAENGGLLVRRADGAVPVEVDPGDVVVMAPDLPHSGGVNRTGSIRYAVYIRWLE